MPAGKLFKELMETSLSQQVVGSQQTRFAGTKKRKIKILKYKFNEDQFNELFDFLMDVDLDVLEDDTLTDLDILLDHLKIIAKIHLNENIMSLSDALLLTEGPLFAKASDLKSKHIASVSYRKNRNKIKARKNSIAKKKIERQKSRLNKNNSKFTTQGKMKVKYNTKNHVSEMLELKELLLEKTKNV